MDTRRVIFSVIILVLSVMLSTASGQSNQSELSSSLSVGYTLHDFSTVRYLKESVPTAFRQKQVGRLNQMFSGINLSYRKELNYRFAINTQIGGAFINKSSASQNRSESTEFFAELNSLIQFRPLKSSFFIEPHFELGISTAYHPSKYSLAGIVGLGMTIPFNQDIFLDLSTSYRVGLVQNNPDHLFFNMSIGGILSRKPGKWQKNGPLLLSLRYDKDFDGTPDSIDVCPDIPGILLLKGCPDTDSDSIPDHEDRCPYQKGILELLGCPLLDSDNDGITDDIDSCVLTPGFYAYKGCPVPDRDADGLNDEVDSCISLPGPIANNGCPIPTIAIQTQLSELAKSINFSSGQYRLSNDAIEALEHVARILNSNSSVEIIIEAHTDDIGSIEANLHLSKKRSQSIQTYLLSKGISSDRMSSFGYGESKPLESNNTEKGRSHNRRVELLVENLPITNLKN
jgi:OOP family OmpA-OmpF porin